MAFSWFKNEVFCLQETIFNCKQYFLMQIRILLCQFNNIELQGLCLLIFKAKDKMKEELIIDPCQL
jgi:hypothetical protein